jgi:hypothetical protein
VKNSRQRPDNRSNQRRDRDPKRQAQIPIGLMHAMLHAPFPSPRTNGPTAIKLATKLAFPRQPYQPRDTSPPRPTRGPIRWSSNRAQKITHGDPGHAGWSHPGIQPDGYYRVLREAGLIECDPVPISLCEIAHNRDISDEEPEVKANAQAGSIGLRAAPRGPHDVISQ